MHLTRAIEHYSDFVVGRGEGSWVFEAGDTGRKALDFSTGYATASTGHCHPRVVQAISEQAGRLIHGETRGPCMLDALWAFVFAELSPMPFHFSRPRPLQATPRSSL